MRKAPDFSDALFFVYCAPTRWERECLFFVYCVSDFELRNLYQYSLCVAVQYAHGIFIVGVIDYILNS